MDGGNWTYLFAQHPRGLQADLQKASHHGGRVWLEKRLAFDSMMTSIRRRRLLAARVRLSSAAGVALSR